MEHKLKAFVSTCIIALMMASCTVTTHTRTQTPPPPPPPPAHYGHPHYGHPHHGPGPKRYPIDQFRKGPGPHHKGPQAPPPPAPVKPKTTVRDVEKNKVRNSGTTVHPRQTPQESSDKNLRSNSQQQRNTQPSSSTPSNTRSQRSNKSSDSGTSGSSSRTSRTRR